MEFSLFSTPSRKLNLSLSGDGDRVEIQTVGKNRCPFFTMSTRKPLPNLLENLLEDTVYRT